MNSANISSNNGLIRSSGNATLVFGILSIITSFLGVGFVLGVIGIIVGFIELIRFKQSGKRKVTAGIICCLLGIIISVIFSISFASSLLS